MISGARSTGPGTRARPPAPSIFAMPAGSVEDTA